MLKMHQVSFQAARVSVVHSWFYHLMQLLISCPYTDNNTCDGTGYFPTLLHPLLLFCQAKSLVLQVDAVCVLLTRWRYSFSEITFFYIIVSLALVKLLY